MQRMKTAKKPSTATRLTPAPRTAHAPSVHDHVLMSVAVDDARLLLAIQALDAASDAATSPSTSLYPLAIVIRVLQALAYFLEISLHLEEAADETTRQRVALVLEARVLSCITRFLQGKARRRAGNVELFPEEDRDPGPAWQSWRCPATTAESCVAGAIRTALLCFLFQLCRQATSAVLVMRSGLHSFLLNECRLLHANPEAASSVTQCNAFYYDARDLLVGVDPFEWSTRGLFMVIQREGPDCEVFQLPIGARSLSYLLETRRLPSNEADELAILLDKTRHASASSPSKSPLRNGHQRKPKPRKLPSIFHFPTQFESSAADSEPCAVCSPRHNAGVWKIVRLESTRVHLAVRAVVALALHLPSASPEHKKFLRDGGLEVLKTVGSGNWDLDASIDDHPRDLEALPAEDLPIMNQQADVVRGMALAGVRLFEAEASDEAIKPPPAAKSPTRLITTPKSPLRDKLQGITEENRRQVAFQQRQEFVKQRDDDRQQLRRRVCELFGTAQRTRTHLLESLAVLTTGRDHPAGANQSIVAWLDSFPTIEKKEQQRKEEEEQRQRRLVELQYLVEERRRRQRDECLLMAKNDFDTPDTHEKARDNAKKEAFQRLQRELRAMEQREHEEKQQRDQDGDKKRAAALEEARRVQLVADQLRRETHENELMKREDHYYAEKILREKHKREQHEKLVKQIDPIAEQQKRIERMRQQDRERKQIEQEIEVMRGEDLLARQMRFLENQRHKEEVEREWKARRTMEAEERFMRQQWKRIDEAAAKQQQDELKQRRAEERRLKREQEQQWKTWQAAWTTSYDAYGNVYYYNQLTGETQWENPLQYWTGASEGSATTDPAATWQDTSQWPQ